MSELIPAWLGLSPDVSIRWGLTLLHFLWQGAVIGLLAFVAARLLRNQSATVRYWLNAAALLACPVCVAGTFAVVDLPEAWRESSHVQSLETPDAVTVPTGTTDASNLVDLPYPVLNPPPAMVEVDVDSNPLEIATSSQPLTPAPVETVTSSATGWMPIIARWIAILYTVGAVCFFIRLAIALWGGHRLRAISTPVSDSALLELIRSQAHRIGLKLVPVVAYCERVAVPTVIGVLRPMILLPATLTIGLTTDELSAILSHELAHIRRYDLWMNLLQRIIESLLFFHPVVWFLSRRLSAEREICCDDLVVRSGHQPMNYAGALLRMAELCAGSGAHHSLAIAAVTGGPTLLEYRVLRLIRVAPPTRLNLNRTMLMLMVGLVLFASLMSWPIRRWFLMESPQGPSEAVTAIAGTESRFEGPQDESVDPASSEARSSVNNDREVPPAQTETENSAEVNSEPTESISITGRVLDFKQKPIAGARVFVVSSLHTVVRKLSDTVSKDDGSYEFRDLKLPIVLNETSHDGRKAVGAFEIFALSDPHGFTWRASRRYWPDSKPLRSTTIGGGIEAEVETEFPAPDSPAEFFSGDDIELDLVFDEPAPMRLLVVDDEGQPIRDAQIRLWNADPIPGFVRERFANQIRGASSMEFQTLYDPGLMPPELVSRTTDKDGWFEYSAMPLNCEFRIQVRPKGFAERMIHATTGDNYKSQHTVLYRSGDDLVFPRTAEVNVTVKFADTLQPAPRVWVHGGGWHGSGSQHDSTNESGQIVLNLPPGECSFTVLPEYKTPYVFVDDGSLRTQVDRDKKNEFEILLQPAAEVEIRVVDAETEQPVAGADLWSLLPDKSGKRRHEWSSFEQPNLAHHGPMESDENGIIQTYFAPGKYSIGLCDYSTPDGYAPTAIADAVPVEFKAGEKQTVTLKINRAMPVAQNKVQPLVDVPVPLRYPHCVLEIENLQPRPLSDAIAQFNRTSLESPTGVRQLPVTEQETRDAITKFAAEKHVPEAVRVQLEDILKSGALPSNVYFRRFTRFDDGKQMQGVWWVRLVVETKDGPVYSVPVRTHAISRRPYTQMERQQNAADGMMLLNRVSSYETLPSTDAFPARIPVARDSQIEALIEKAETALKAGDRLSLLNLFDWNNASESTREFVTEELNRLLSGTVHDVWYSPREGHEVSTWSAWQSYKPNLPLVGYLKISFSTEAGKEDSSPENHQILALELGVDGDELRLVNYVPDGEANLPKSLSPRPSISGHVEPLADGTHLVTDVITNPGTLLSAHLANEEVRLRDLNATSKANDADDEANAKASSNDQPENKDAGAVEETAIQPVVEELAASPPMRDWTVHHIDDQPSVEVDGFRGYRVVFQRSWKEFTSPPQSAAIGVDQGPFEMRSEDWEFVLISLEPKKAPADLRSKIAWRDSNSPYHTRDVCLGEGHGSVWFTRGTLYGQELVRQSMKLATGDDRIQLMMDGLRVKDAGTATANTCQSLIGGFGEAALPYIRKTVDETRKAEELWRVVGCLSFIPAEQATELLLTYYDSTNEDIRRAAEYALIRKPYRPAAKRAYLDMLQRKSSVERACEACLEFQWTEAVPILRELVSHPANLQELQITIPARRALEGNPIPDELLAAARLIEQNNVGNPQDMSPEVAAAYKLLKDSSDAEAANLLALRLVNFTAKMTVNNIRFAGFFLLIERERESTLKFLISVEQSLPEKERTRIRQLRNSLSMFSLGVESGQDGVHRRSTPLQEKPKESQPVVDDSRRTLVATIPGRKLFLDEIDDAAFARSKKGLSQAELNELRQSIRGERLLQRISAKVVADYVELEKIAVSPEMARELWESVLTWPGPPPRPDDDYCEEAGRLMSYASGYASLMDWLICKSLYERYGGRVGTGSLGLWIAVDGRNELMKEYIRDGRVQIHDTELEKAFWKAANKPNFADAYPKGEDLKRAMTIPPYKRR